MLSPLIKPLAAWLSLRQITSYCLTHAKPLARLCQGLGIAVPTQWHNCAKGMAQTLRTKGETPFVVNPLSHTIKQSTNLQSLQQFRWQLPSAYYRCLLLFHNPDRHRSLHWLLTVPPVPASPAKLYLLPYVVLLHMHRNDLLQYPECLQTSHGIH